MKSRPPLEGKEKKPPVSPASHLDTAASSGRSVHLEPSSDNLQTRITARAYELYIERGRREGYSMEDWVDAEQELLGWARPSRRC